MQNHKEEAKLVNDMGTEYTTSDILYMLRDLPDACCVFKLVTDHFGTLKDMQFIFANEKYASLVGRTTAELIGSRYYEVVTNRDEDWIKLSYQAGVLRQSVINRTYNTQFNRWFEFWAVPVYKKNFCAFIIHDVTAEKRREESIEIKRHTNNLIIDCAKLLSENEFKISIKDVLKLLGTKFKADRVYIVEKNKDQLGDIFEWVNKQSGSGLPSKNIFDEYDMFTMIERRLMGNKVVVVDDSSIIKEKNETFYNEVLAGTISRFIIAALVQKNEIIGYLIADNYSEELEINTVEAFETIAVFLASELRNYRLANEMLYMTNHDALTGLGNRYSYNSTIGMMEGMQVDVGVCFIDINGLKEINDNMGHEAGDEMIKNVAVSVASSFKKKYCYRIGGDELVAIIPQITEEHFYEEVEKLKKKSKKYAMAIGAMWKASVTDIKELIQTADGLMYEDKKAYHEKNNK